MKKSNRNSTRHSLVFLFAAMVCVVGCDSKSMEEALNKTQKKLADASKDVQKEFKKSLDESTKDFNELKKGNAPDIDTGAKAPRKLTPDEAVKRLTTLQSSAIQDADIIRVSELGAEKDTITKLNLEGNILITAAGMEALAKITSIVELNLAGVTHAPAGSKSLGKMTNLQVLNVSGTTFADEHLAPLGNLSSLRELDLSTTYVTDAGFIHLKPLALEWLNMERLKINGSGMEHLSTSKLQKINAKTTQFGQFGCKHLEGAPALTHADLISADMSNEALKSLSTCVSLTYIRLNKNPNIDSKGITALGKLSKLQEIHFEDDLGMDDRGLLSFKRCKDLTYMNLRRTRVTAAGLGRFKRPDVKIDQ